MSDDGVLTDLRDVPFTSLTDDVNADVVDTIVDRAINDDRGHAIAVAAFNSRI